MSTGRVPDPAEIAEDLARIERAVVEGAAETRQAIHDLSSRIERTYVRQDVYKERQDAVAAQIALAATKAEQVENRHTWVARTAVVALILPIVVALMVALILGVR